MMVEEEDKRAKFLRIYANVPESVREDVLVVIDKKTYTWNTVYLEVRDNTSLGEKILKALGEMEII